MVFEPKNLVIPLSIALLAVISYLPALTQPLIEDDYPNIKQARVYGPLTGWTQMARDDIHRVRATSWVLTYWIERSFGLRPIAFYAVSMLLHVGVCLLIYALGRWEAIGFGVSAWSAAFFAIYEGHQEAIMWFSGGSELLLLLFGALTLLCWLSFLEQKQQGWRWYFSSLFFFILALLSKESAPVIVPLLLLTLLVPELKLRSIVFLSPFAVLGVLGVVFIFQTQNHSFRFHDGSFELSAPFWETWTKSFFILFWPWGWLAVIALFVWRKSAHLMWIAVVWVSVSFVPYMFVDYVHRIPSRQTYLASAGLSLIVGAAVVVLRERTKPTRAWLAITLLGIMLLHNVVYLWTRKHQQFLERAEPTEQLIAFTRSNNGLIYVRCFPRPPSIGDAAVEVALGKPPGTLIWDETEARRLQIASTFCYESK